MVVDLIGIYVLKGPYCTLTMTDWFLQALSVIARGSWGDVARRFTMIRWGYIVRQHTSHKPSSQAAAHPSPPRLSQPPPPCHRAAAACRDRTCSDHLVVEIPFMENSSVLLVQTDEGVLFPVVDRIRRSTAAYR
ncbi:hypothetical protein F511_06799 [Dorcoceras hygrometricum]|uniref:Uncharacterized protein n=1 Tax=Dorcoceras hygrometricum TaxID=472368 RepID=A0A2Z7CE01_9LAMI|nr:hypothetical protein F511_06799 [Dorcoceras hygrometricum]